MEETTNKIICSGKIRFTSPAQAIEVQLALLDNGYKFFTGKQEPRNCHGVMWRNREIRSAANPYAFKAYGVPLVSDLWQTKQVAVKVEKEPYTAEKRAEQARKAGLKHKEIKEGRIFALMSVVRRALINIAEYEHNLYGTNSRSMARKRAWEVLVKECARLHGEPPVVNSLQTAIRRVLGEKNKPFMISDSRFTASILKGI